VVSDGCLSHKTAVALCALSQYIRFILSLTSAADRHLININFLVEPYRLPQKSTPPVTRSTHVPSTAENVRFHQELKRVKESDNLPVHVAKAVANNLSSDKKRDHEGVKTVREFPQDGDYDERSEVELDRDDVRPAQSQDGVHQEVVPQNVVITSSSLVHSYVIQPAVTTTAAATGRMRSRADPGIIQHRFKSQWILLVVAVFLLVFWFRCLRCFRCGFLLRHCRSMFLRVQTGALYN